MKDLAKSEVDTQKVILTSGFILLVVFSLVAWTKEKKDESWKHKYQEAVKVCLESQPDSLARAKIIQKLNRN
jgi:hypothetical protein